MKRVLTTLLFDLDQTLYEPATGLLAAGDARITAHLAERLGLPSDEADELRRRLWRQYGTTARGAEIEFGLSQAEMYEASFEGLDPAEYLKPDPELATLLASLPVERYVLTNSHGTYARSVLAALGLAELFVRVFAIEDLAWRPKPDTLAYGSVLKQLGQPAAGVGLVDDFAHNLPPAAAVGIFTIFLGEGAADADLCVTSLHDLPEALKQAQVSLAGC